jgi:RNA polymerase sigma-70 factor (ECF subfamily)
MRAAEGMTTSPTLLERVADWADHTAWLEFFQRYDPLLQRGCRRFLADPGAADDLRQQIWIELARRMRTYRYDPGRTFRGWLRRLCEYRALDWLRSRGANDLPPLDTEPVWVHGPSGEDGEDVEALRPRLLGEAQRVQEAVRQRVDPKTWEAFWRIAVEGLSVRETADALGMSYASAFAAQKRVGERLRAEGQRRMAERPPPGAKPEATP